MRFYFRLACSVRAELSRLILVRLVRLSISRSLRHLRYFLLVASVKSSILIANIVNNIKSVDAAINRICTHTIAIKAHAYKCLHTHTNACTHTQTNHLYLPRRIEFGANTHAHITFTRGHCTPAPFNALSFWADLMRQMR